MQTSSGARYRWVTRGRVALLVVSLLVVVGVGGCWKLVQLSFGDPTPPDGYEAVPDDQLLAVIRRIPGVTSASLTYVKDWESGSYYDGEIHLRPDLTRNEQYAVRDQTELVLRHGRWDPGETYGTVYLLVPGHTLTPGRDGLFGGVDPDAVYGPQTGTEDWTPALAGLAARAASGTPAVCRDIPYPYLEPVCRSLPWDSEVYQAPGPDNVATEPPRS